MKISIIISSETFLLNFKVFISVVVIYVKWVDGNEAWKHYEVVILLMFIQHGVWAPKV